MRGITGKTYVTHWLLPQATLIFLPVDSPWALVRLNVHLVVIDIHLWDLHLKVVGQQLDGLAHCTHAWPAGGMEHLLQGWGEDPHGHWTNRGTGREPWLGADNRGEEVCKSTRTDEENSRITDKGWSREGVVNEVLVSSRGRGQEGMLLGTGQEGSVGRDLK